MIFVMVSTARSVPYTEVALISLFRNTAFGLGDTLVLIVNEPGAMPDMDRIEANPSSIIMVEHVSPRGFAANMNIGIDMAREARSDLICLNNDIVFTPKWLEPITRDDAAIVLPVCNQQFQYHYDGLNLTYFMTLDDFSGRHTQLELIAARHVEGHAARPRRRDLLMPFYCVFLPYQIMVELGRFDETFGAGGAEDIDYRVRALRAGFDVRYATQSYVLHFMGQSTWRSGETRATTVARDELYRKRFTEKWGASMSSVLLPGVPATDLVRNLDVADYVRRNDYPGLIQACLGGDPPPRPA